MNYLFWKEYDQAIWYGISFISSLLWFTYWLVSRRVKYVFTLRGKPFVYNVFRTFVMQKKTIRLESSNYARAKTLSDFMG